MSTLLWEDMSYDLSGRCMDWIGRCMVYKAFEKSFDGEPLASRYNPLSALLAAKIIDLQ